MKSLLLVGILLSLLAWPLRPSYAAEKDETLSQVLMVLTKPAILGPEEREAAKGIAEICRRYADRIPTLSPREQEWLESEFRSPRAEAASRSVESSKKEAGEIARYCVRYAEAAQKAQDRTTAVITWIFLVRTFLKPDFRWHIGNLAAKGEVGFSEHDVDVIETLHWLGGEILEKIVLFGHFSAVEGSPP